MLQDFANNIREDEQEYAIEEVQEAAMEYAYNVTYEATMENLKEATGCNWISCNRFIAFLDGDYDLDPLQSAMLKELIESLENKHESKAS